MQDASEGADEEVGAWDAVALVCESRLGRSATAESSLASRLMQRALGRDVHPAVRVAALHALATCAGAEELGPGATALTDAFLPPSVRTCLARTLAFRALRGAHNCVKSCSTRAAAARAHQCRLEGAAA